MIKVSCQSHSERASSPVCKKVIRIENLAKNIKYKHSDACIYLLPYKLDVLKIVEYKFSWEMEAHVEVTTSKRHFNV